MMPLEQPASLADWKITPTFEHRIRFERRINRDFLDALPDNTTDWLFRTRIGFLATDKRGSKVVFIYQRSTDDQAIAGRCTKIDNSDVSQFYWEGKSSGWTWGIGRFPYKLGDGRLIASQGGWGNLGRTFEGAYAKNKTWEFAAFREAVNTPSNKQMFTGLASVNTTAGQTSFIARNNERTKGDTRLFTLNHIKKVADGKYLWTLEGSLQWGRNDGRDHSAFAAVVNLSRSLGPSARVYIEAGAASGGSGQTSRTFDPLYQSAVPPYGLRSQAGFRNMLELTLGGSWQATKKLKVDGVATLVSLFDAKDGWYGLSGGLNRKPGGVYRDPEGKSGRSVGGFFQLEAVYVLTKRDTLAAGFGVFCPGPFVRSQLDRPAQAEPWGYLQYTFRY